ncbi:hypothetical protein CLV97_101284 [Planifilum fimeticola]|jgi:hypothetical protein|uniref:Uncharacterized protein n=1 Tax=Planifilum fimeticola TaxID=201975 RepID=A0A2T0LJY0_9BACL|nr:hypothetical protein [Planifilum fimeticola]PRX42793.1 hypothetical protein CLV97_101284 [Planifilum fimeticola]
MAENNERLLMFTFWGAYLKEDYIKVGLDVTETLMKHFGMVRRLYDAYDNYDINFNNIDTIDAIRKEVLGKGERYCLFKVNFYNPIVTEEIYVNRLIVNRPYLFLEEYDGLKFYQTEDEVINAQRTQALLKVFTDVAGHPSLDELWMLDFDWNGFMGKPAYLYRPDPLYERVEDPLDIYETKDEVTRLVEEFEAHVPRDWVIDYLQDRLGAESVQEMGDGKIRVLFFDRELTKSKVNTEEFLRTFERHVDEYLLQKGIRLYKG